jgi:hypothetical protein
VGREQHVDVDKGTVHVFKPCLDVPVDLWANWRQRVLAAGRKGDAAVLHLRARRQPKRVTHTERAPRLDLLNDRGTAAEQRVPVAFLFLEGDRFAQSAERRAVFRIYIVFEKFVRPFPNDIIME